MKNLNDLALALAMPGFLYGGRRPGFRVTLASDMAIGVSTRS